MAIMSKKMPSNLLEQNSALGTYLDDMLQQATEVSTAADLEKTQGNLLDETLLMETLTSKDDSIAIAVDNSALHLPKTVIEIEEEGQAEPKQAILDDLHEELPADLFPLQFLTFSIGDNMLSIPLIKMSNVVEWGDTLTLTRLPNEPDWVHGILQHRDQKVRVVDSAEVLQIRSQNAGTPEYILILGGDHWGITCDAIDNVVTLEYADIQWNENVGNKMTLGTIRDTLAVLLSPRGIVECLQSAS